MHLLLEPLNVWDTRNSQTYLPNAKTTSVEHWIPKEKCNKKCDPDIEKLGNL